MPALALAAVGSAGVETSVALSADHLIAVVLGGKETHAWLNDS